MESYDKIFSFSATAKENFEQHEGIECLDELQNDENLSEELVSFVHKILFEHFDGQEENSEMIESSNDMMLIN